MFEMLDSYKNGRKNTSWLDLFNVSKEKIWYFEFDFFHYMAKIPPK